MFSNHQSIQHKLHTVRLPYLGINYNPQIYILTMILTNYKGFKCTFRASCYSTLFVMGASSDLGQPFHPRQNHDFEIKHIFTDVSMCGGSQEIRLHHLWLDHSFFVIVLIKRFCLLMQYSALLLWTPQLSASVSI